MGKKNKKFRPYLAQPVRRAVAFLLCGNQKKKKKKLKKGSLDTGNQDVGFLVTPLSSKVRLLPKEAGGHIKLKSPGEKNTSKWLSSLWSRHVNICHFLPFHLLKLTSEMLTWPFVF